jgi:hypothetical protein
MNIIRKIVAVAAITTTLGFGTFVATASATSPATYCTTTLFHEADNIINNDDATEKLVLGAWEAGIAAAANNYGLTH